MEILLLSVVQLATGLIIACTIMLVGIAAHEAFVNANREIKNVPHKLAEVRPIGAWQYDHDFFDMITEFRNDFSGK